MKKRTLLMAALLLMTGVAAAQNSLTVEDFTMPQNGGSIAVTLTLDEADKYVAYGFKIHTPEGMAYVVDAEDDVACTLISGHDASHVATAHWTASDRILTVGVASMSSKLLKGQTVKMEIPLAGTTAAMGTVFDFTIKEITFIDKDGTKAYPANTSFSVTIDEDRILLNETSTTAPDAVNGANVLVKRTINANEWSTICLPFSMTATQIQAAFGNDVTVELADADSYETTLDDDDNVVHLKINFNNVSPLAIEANHPYVIRLSSSVTSFTVDGVDVNPATSVSGRRKKIGQGSYIIGNYENGTVVPAFGLFLSGNQFWYSIGDTKMKAFRAYFSLKDVLTEVEDAAARISFNFEEATGIGNVNLNLNDNRYYDLQGRRVAQPAKGLYIRNGKKEIVK